LEYLLWWTKSSPSAPLATTGTPASLGILGDPGTTVLFGNNFDYGDQSGGRVTVGFWYDEGYMGAELTGFFLEEKKLNDNAASDANGNPLIGRPVVNAITGENAVLLVAFPGALSGAITVNTSQQFYGAEANFVGSLYRSKCFNVDSIIGFRYLGLEETLNVNSRSTVLPGGIAAFNGALVPIGDTVTISDHFDTRNDFYGGQVGVRTEFRWWRMYATLSGKFAVGNAHEVVNANGVSSLLGPDGTALQTIGGGLLAVSTNSGIVSHDELTFVPSAAAKLGIQINRYLSAFIAYDFLYWYDTARAANQVNLVVNPTEVPANLAFGVHEGPPSPLQAVQKTDFWAQGISFGLELRY
jgi:hypothetical protein